MKKNKPQKHKSKNFELELLKEVYREFVKVSEEKELGKIENKISNL